MAIALEQQIRQLAHVATGDKLVCPRSSLSQINPNLPYASCPSPASEDSALASSLVVFGNNQAPSRFVIYITTGISLFLVVTHERGFRLFKKPPSPVPCPVQSCSRRHNHQDCQLSTVRRNFLSADSQFSDCPEEFPVFSSTSGNVAFSWHSRGTGKTYRIS